MAAVLQMKLSMARANLIYSNFTEPCSQGCSQQLIIGADNGLAPNELGGKPLSETVYWRTYASLGLDVLKDHAFDQFVAIVLNPHSTW